MTVEQVKQAIKAMRRYLTDSPIREGHWRKGVKCLNLFGGEPLLHPQIKEIIGAMHVLPQKHRALYTGIEWKRGPLRQLI